MPINESVNLNNIILMTDSYKLTHYRQYPVGTERVYSYFEARAGAAFPYTVFFGLQYKLLEFLQGVAVTQEDLEEAAELSGEHFMNSKEFNRAGWQYIIDEHGGKLPVRIKAVPEGMVVPINNVLMTIENTDDKCWWLTNALESMLTHIWHACNVATISRHVKEMMASYLEQSADDMSALMFMLHDFGYRGAAGHEAAAVGGAGHLLNFLGTDTLPAMQVARRYYGADLKGLAYSVPATEHSTMTALGPEGEKDQIDRIIIDNKTGILSMVGDSYDIYEFTHYICSKADELKARTNPDGSPARFVERPDSITQQHKDPAELTLWIVETLGEGFGYTVNSKGYKVLDPHVRVLWGDGIGPDGVDQILAALVGAGWSAENIVFGMGGGLLQKHNRDTQRFATKASAMRDADGWRDVFKNPLDATKASKRGRLSLIDYEGRLTTVSEPDRRDDLLRVVFENGEVFNETTFAEARERAALTPAHATV